MSEQYKNAVCRGSWALGSACGKCERCIETNPHKSKHMSEQNEEFEKWFNNKLAECRANNDMDMHRNLSRYVGFYQYGFEAATAEANKRIDALESEVAELKELLRDRTQDLEFEYNRAQENFLSCGILQSKLDELNELHEGINCPVCGSLAVTPKEIWYTKQISELQASNNTLREALEASTGTIHSMIRAYQGLPTDYERIKLNKALLEATPAESLQAFENEVIEKCANVIENGNFLTESSPEYMFAKSAAKAIRALKEVKW